MMNEGGPHANQAFDLERIRKSRKQSPLMRNKGQIEVL